MEYQTYQIQKEKEFEETCHRCGNCCGAQDDPCIHLIIQSQGNYSCDIYDSRGGVQKTLEGKFFECVSIRDILHGNWLGNWNCAYKQCLNRQIE